VICCKHTALQLSRSFEHSPSFLYSNTQIWAGSYDCRPSWTCCAELHRLVLCCSVSAVLLCADQLFPFLNLLGVLLPAEGTFRPERIRAIAARFNLDTEAVLDNVSTSKVLATSPNKPS
jgi:hypothetical protein